MRTSHLQFNQEANRFLANDKILFLWKVTMKKTILWILGILAILFVLGFAFGGWAGYGGCCGWGGYGRYDDWGLNGAPGMMAGMMEWGFSPLGWISIIFMVLIRLGLLALAVLGIVWLVRSISETAAAPAASKTCSNCGQPIQANWQHCPYCGTALTK
jgi:hypothetical protein